MFLSSLWMFWIKLCNQFLCLISFMSPLCCGQALVTLYLLPCFVFVEEDAIPKTMSAIGYGVTDDYDYQGSEELREVELDYVGRNRCKKLYQLKVGVCLCCLSVFYCLLLYFVIATII